MSFVHFQDREQAGWQLGERLKGLPLSSPLVLAIPRGGIDVGLPIARTLNADLDVVLVRKLRAPFQPELALGAVSESGEVYLNQHAAAFTEAGDSSLERERQFQLIELERRRRLFRAVRPQASLSGRSVIITDDGIATGSTMIAALRFARSRHPAELIVAVPVAPEDRLDDIRELCDRVVCLIVPDDFWAVGQFYRHFAEVSDEHVVAVLRTCGSRDRRHAPERSSASTESLREPKRS